MNESPKSQLQSEQYRFPYHHIPHFRGHGRPSVVRSLSWGLEYLCYTGAAVAEAARLRPASVLDVGCGDGAFLAMLRDAGLGNLLGIDLVPAALRHARAFVPEARFEERDVRELPETFELVTAIEVLEHIDDELMPRFTRALQERVNPGGHLIVCVPTTVRKVNRKHFRHYDLELLQSTFAANAPELTLVDSYGVFAESRLISALNRIFFNRVWSLEIPAVQAFAWRYVQRHLAQATPATGCHLVAVFRRSSRSWPP